jgi:hypothetical protein
VVGVAVVDVAPVEIGDTTSSIIRGLSPKKSSGWMYPES